MPRDCKSVYVRNSWEERRADIRLSPKAMDALISASGLTHTIVSVVTVSVVGSRLKSSTWSLETGTHREPKRTWPVDLPLKNKRSRLSILFLKLRCKSHLIGFLDWG